jgi:hypothetical protein
MPTGTSNRPVAADFNGDGRRELLVVTNDGTGRFLDPSSGALVAAVPLARPRHAGLTVGDLTGDGVPEIVLASEDRGLYCFRAPTVLGRRGAR